MMDLLGIKDLRRQEWRRNSPDPANYDESKLTSILAFPIRSS